MLRLPKAQSWTNGSVQGVYKGVRAWSRRALEKAGERVIDVQPDGENEDDDEETSTK